MVSGNIVSVIRFLGLLFPQDKLFNPGVIIKNKYIFQDIKHFSNRMYMICRQNIGVGLGVYFVFAKQNWRVSATEGRTFVTRTSTSVSFKAGLS